MRIQERKSPAEIKVSAGGEGAALGARADSSAARGAEHGEGSCASAAHGGSHSRAGGCPKKICGLVGSLCWSRSSDPMERGAHGTTGWQAGSTSLHAGTICSQAAHCGNDPILGWKEDSEEERAAETASDALITVPIAGGEDLESSGVQKSLGRREGGRKLF